MGSFTPSTRRKYKINLIRTLTYRCFQASLILESFCCKMVTQSVITFNVNGILNRNKNKQKQPCSYSSQKLYNPITITITLHRSSQQRLKSCVYNFYSFVDLKIPEHTPYQISLSIQGSPGLLSDVQSNLQSRSLGLQ